MITDLFEHCICRACGNATKFSRLEILQSSDRTDFLCCCIECGTLFIRAYELQV